MSNIPKILSLDIRDVLNKLWYFPDKDYIVQWNNIKMKENWRVTWWWNWQIRWKDWCGFLKCNSWKKPWRFEWDVLKMVQDKLNISQAEAITWFENNNFGLTKKNKKEEKNIVIEKWSSLEWLTDWQIEYLLERLIDYNLVKEHVKNFDWSIWLQIVSENWNKQSIQWRNHLSKNKKDRYRILEGTSAKGLFADFKNIDKDSEVYLVEWMTDYLTLAQFTPNVIGLVAKWNWIEEIKALKNKYKFIFIPDNDLGGEETLEKLAEVNMWVFSISSYEENWVELNDVNDFWNYCKRNHLDWDDMLKIFKDECKRPLTNIQMALKKAIRNREHVWRLTGEKTFDWATWWIVPWTTFLINGPSWQGKTTWAMWILMKMLKQWKRIWFFSQETDTGKMLAQVLWYNFWKNRRKHIYPKVEYYLEQYWEKNLDWLLLYDDVRTLDDIEKIIKEEKLDIAFIDYAQIVDWLPGSSPKEQMWEYAKRAQQIARDTYTCMISLSQTPKSEEVNVPVLYRSPMEAMALKAAADTMINVWIYNWQHMIWFVKCKEWDDDAWRKEYETTRDKNTWEIWIFKDEQISEWF